jgi:hypothetical protein
MNTHGKFSMVQLAAEGFKLSTAWRTAVYRIEGYKARGEESMGRRLGRHMQVVNAAARGELVSECAFVMAADFISEDTSGWEGPDENARMASDAIRALKTLDWVK